MQMSQRKLWAMPMCGLPMSVGPAGRNENAAFPDSTAAAAKAELGITKAEGAQVDVACLKGLMVCVILV